MGHYGAMELGLVWAAFVLGLRHGIDWDHIAAITDISGSQTSPRPALFLATLYALGHALVVFVLGTIAIVAGDLVPAAVDAAMERIVGITLLALGGYLVYSLARFRGEVRPQSRWMLLIRAVRRYLSSRTAATEIVEFEHSHEHDHGERSGHVHTHEPETLGTRSGPPVATRAEVRTRAHAHAHVHRAPMPADPFADYGRASSFGIGMLHGVGAETPSQLLLFVAAVGTGGRLAGLFLLVAFLIGLIVTNTAVAVASAYGFGPAHSRRVHQTMGVVVATFSLALGTLYLLGRGDLVPGLL